MYEYDDLEVMAECAADAAKKEIDERGINIYLNAYGEDGSNYDIHIDPRDAKGIELFREFAAKMSEHYKTL